MSNLIDWFKNSVLLQFARFLWLLF